jgi:hypothetical protein
MMPHGAAICQNRSDQCDVECRYHIGLQMKDPFGSLGDYSGNVFIPFKLFWNISPNTL